MRKEDIARLYKDPITYSTTIDPHFESIWNDLLDKLVLPENSYILDLACGTGKTLGQIAKRNKHRKIYLEGVDLSPEMVTEAKKNKFEEGKGKNLQLCFHCQDCLKFLSSGKEDKYHLVIASFLLAFVDARKLFPLVYRSLKKEGKFVIMTTSFDELKDIEKEFFKFAISRFYYFKWWDALTLPIKKVHFLPPIETIVKNLFEAKFAKIEITKLQAKMTFSDPLEGVRWVDTFGCVYFDLLKEEKKEKFFLEALKYVEKHNLKYFGEPIKKGSPFKLILPLYQIIAEK